MKSSFFLFTLSFIIENIFHSREKEILYIEMILFTVFLSNSHGNSTVKDETVEISITYHELEHFTVCYVHSDAL